MKKSFVFLIAFSILTFLCVNFKDSAIVSRDNSLDKSTTLTEEKDKKTSTFYPSLAASFSIYTLDMNALSKGMKSLYNYGIRDIIICPRSDILDPTTSQVKMKGTIDDIRIIIILAKSIGLNVVGLKFHDYLSKREPIDFNKWFDNYKILMIQLSDLAVEQRVQNFCISCELKNVTNQGKDRWVKLIKVVKGKGLRTYCALSNGEEDTCVFLNSLDVIGFNRYPILSNSGLDSTIEECRNRLYSNKWEYSSLVNTKKKYNKPIWITETGCTSYINALSKPYEWRGNIIGPKKHNKIQTLYYETVLPYYGQMVYDDKPLIEKICLWDFSTSANVFSFIGNPLAEKTVKKYLKNAEKK